MAWYVNPNRVVNVAGNSNRAEWTNIYNPGSKVPISGIYFCLGCNREVTVNNGDPFPPQNHHQHLAGQGTVRWRMLVMTNTSGAG